MEITRHGQILEVPGKQLQVGESAAPFSLRDLSDQLVTLADFVGKPTILSIVPDIDTRVCALQTKRFNQEASQVSGINFATISNNTKEEQAVWCGLEGVDMLMLHDTEHTFGASYHLLIPEVNRLARAIFVLDQNGVIVYREIVAEITNEPDYAQALAAAKALI